MSSRLGMELLLSDADHTTGQTPPRIASSLAQLMASFPQIVNISMDLKFKDNDNILMLELTINSLKMVYTVIRTQCQTKVPGQNNYILYCENFLRPRS